MTDTTTISITEAQRDELAALKKHDRESYKAVIDRLLADGTAAADAPAEDVRVAIREELSKHASETANRRPPMDSEISEQLDRIESAATTAEARTGRIEGTLEDMGGR